MLVMLPTTQSREKWQRTADVFVAAGLPIVVRGVIKKLR